MVWKVLTAVLAAIIAVQLLLPHVRKVRGAGRPYSFLGVLGGLLLGAMFAGLVATLFIETDRARQIDALITGAFALSGAVLLIVAEHKATKK